MNNSKPRSGKSTAHKRLAMVVGLILLIVFIGRVALVTIYGYAGIPKATISTAAETEQGDDDKKEENKYAEKQFKCFAPQGYTEPLITMLFIKKASYLLFTANIYPIHSLTVLTPPPNC